MASEMLDASDALELHRVHKTMGSVKRLSRERSEGKQVLDEAQNQLLRFAEADADGNMSLDFDEFYACLPPKLRETFDTSTIRTWFNEADLDASGALSMSEFFLFTLRNAADVHGSNVVHDIFAQFDQDGSGSIRIREFQRRCDELGFGAVGHQLFRALDPDGERICSSALGTCARASCDAVECARAWRRERVHLQPRARARAAARRPREVRSRRAADGGVARVDVRRREAPRARRGATGARDGALGGERRERRGRARSAEDAARRLGRGGDGCGQALRP